MCVEYLVLCAEQSSADKEQQSDSRSIYRDTIKRRYFVAYLCDKAAGLELQTEGDTELFIDYFLTGLKSLHVIKKWVLLTVNQFDID